VGTSYDPKLLGLISGVFEGLGKGHGMIPLLVKDWGNRWVSKLLRVPSVCPHENREGKGGGGNSLWSSSIDLSSLLEPSSMFSLRRGCVISEGRVYWIASLDIYLFRETLSFSVMNCGVKSAIQDRDKV
jgi:hypothetical protein